MCDVTCIISVVIGLAAATLGVLLLLAMSPDSGVRLNLPHPEWHRYWLRIVGAALCMPMSGLPLLGRIAFVNAELATLQEQVAASSSHIRAIEIADEPMSTDYSVTLTNGTTVKWSTTDDRRLGPMSVATGRGGSIGSGSHGSTAVTRGAGRGSHAVRDEAQRSDATDGITSAAIQTL